MSGVQQTGIVPGLSFAEHWARFSARVVTAGERLAAELASCSEQQRRILAAQVEECRTALPPATGEPRLANYRAIRRDAARRLLDSALAEWDRSRPHSRALSAFAEFDRSLDEAVRQAPEVLFAAGAEAAQALAPSLSHPWRARIAAVRKEPRPVALRAVLQGEVERLSLKRLRLERSYWQSLTAATRQMKTAWESARDLVDLAAIEQELSEASLNQWRTGLGDALERVGHDSERALEGWRAWPKQVAEHLADGLLAAVSWKRRRGVRDAPARRTEHSDVWLSRWRAIDAELHLEAALPDVEHMVIGRFGEALDNAAAERDAIHQELDAVIDWLRRAEGEFPSPQADLIPGASRAAELERQVRADLERLPEPFDMAPSPSALHRRSPPRLYPRQALHHAFARTARPEVETVFAIAETEHRELAQTIERARQVVSFGFEVAQAEGNSRLRAEALENAASLLRYYEDRPSSWLPVAESRLARALAGMFIDAHLVLGRRRLGAWTWLAQQGVRRAAPVVVRQGAESLRDGVAASWRLADRVRCRCLEFIGWRRTSQAGRMEVVTRPTLPAEFTARGQPVRLPALYRHLFRVDPVEDPRFLVGRDREMAAIAEARSFWEMGRPASLIIVGTRGSGKTSLVNCAVKQALVSGEVIRGEFQDRVVTEEQVRKHLALITGSDPAGLEGFLKERRRILVIEELERTFLRCIGGYDGIRSLQRLIAATCGSTLWLLTINATAYRFLDAAVQLGTSFSHRIDAATATRENLRRAILQRHGLSGLRLKFAPPERRPQRRLALRAEATPEEAFFDTLAMESDCVFRTAFDIWLSHIDAIEGGVMYMKPLRAPDLSGIVEDLDQSDLFTLSAILEHGSLTVQELGSVFQKSVAASRAQIDELLAREILEPDPGRPGFRVRPKAQRVVTEALYRRNLL